MSYAFTNKSHLLFEPAASLAFAVDVVATPYSTPVGNHVELGDLARLQYLKGSLRYNLQLSAGDGALDCIVKLKNGATVLGQVSIDADGAQQYAGQFVVNIGDVLGADNLTIEVEVAIASGGGVTATIAAALEVESPLIIGG